jgi:DNA-directed RNA polymerase specialized sigma subunit
MNVIENWDNWKIPQLRDFQKNILQTRIHDGRTIRNIAAELGISTSTVLRAGLFSRIWKF